MKREETKGLESWIRTKDGDEVKKRPINTVKTSLTGLDSCDEDQRYLIIRRHHRGKKTNCSHQIKRIIVWIHHQNMAAANLIRADVELIGFEADCINALSLLLRHSSN